MSKCHIGPTSIVTKSAILVIDLHETFSYTMLLVYLHYILQI